MKKLLLVLALLPALALFSLSGVFAITFSSDSAEICATDTAIFVFTVKNEANFDNPYTISLSGDASKWAVAVPAGFKLKPQQSENVYVYVTPSKAALPGTYNLKATANSASGADEGSVVIRVKDCHSASFAADDTSEEICSATEARYTMQLQNTGKYTENFVLSLSGTPSAWSILSEQLVKLEPGQSKAITVYSTPPAAQTGDFTLTVTASSQNSAALAEQKLQLKSNPCYGFSTIADVNYLSFCENSEAKIPLTIENEGTVDNTYALSVQGPAWATIENSKVNVPAGQTRFTNLVLFPGYRVNGDFKFKVIVQPAKGTADSQEITANIKSCHSADLKISAETDTICPNTEKAYEVQLVNTGEFDDTFSINVVGAQYAEIDKSFIDLAAGASDKFNLVLKPKDIPSGNAEIVVQATAQNPPGASASDTLKLEIAQLSSCFGVQTTAAVTKVEVAAGEPAVVPVIIENKGNEESDYNIEVSGTGASFVQLNPASITLAGKGAKTVYAYVAVPEGTSQASYKVTVAARLQDGTISSTSSFDILLVAGKQKAVDEKVSESLQIEAKTSKLRDQIRSFFKSLLDKILGRSEEPADAEPVEEETNATEELRETEVNETAEEENATVEAEVNATTEANETAEANLTLTNETAENLTVSETNETNETAANETIANETVAVENQTVIEEAATNETNATEVNETETNETAIAEANETNVTEEELPEDLSAFLSEEARKKLAGEEEQASEELPEETSSADRLKRNAGLLGTGFASVSEFLTQTTYLIPNWLFIIAVILIVSGLSFLLRKKDLVEKLNQFLEEEGPAKEDKGNNNKGKKKGPSAQELLDETEKKKGKKKNKA